MFYHPRSGCGVVNHITRLSVQRMCAARVTHPRNSMSRCVSVFGVRKGVPQGARVWQMTPEDTDSISDRHLSTWSRKISKSRDIGSKFLNRYEIWQTARQYHCRAACQISRRSEHFDAQPRGFETTRDLRSHRGHVYGKWLQRTLIQ